MQSTLFKLIGEIAPSLDLRENVVSSLPTFVECTQLYAASLTELRNMLELCQATQEGEFALSTWRAALPDLRRLRDEISAVERKLGPPKPVVFVKARRSKKNRRTH